MGHYTYVLKHLSKCPACECVRHKSTTERRDRSEHSQMNRRYCLTLDLKNDLSLIAEYKRHHEKIWPEITQSIRESGIEDMEIYLFGTRMFMIMEVNDSFSFAAKAQADQKNPRVQEWESLMWKFQQSLPQAKPGEKWLRME